MDFKTISAKLPRLIWCAIATLAILAVLFLIAPAQVPVMIYKVFPVPTAGYACYWLDRGLFFYAQPSSYLVNPPTEYAGFIVGDADFEVVDGYKLEFIAATLRRAFIIGMGMLAVGLGL